MKQISKAEKDLNKIIILGKSCSGKSTIARNLQNYGYQKARTVTSRTPRVNETNDDYIFVSDSEFHEMMYQGDLMEWDHHSYGSYGSLKKDYFNEFPTIFVLSPKALISLDTSKFFTVYLDVDLITQIKRSIERNDDLNISIPRIFNEQDEYQYVSQQVDLVIDATLEIDEICKQIIAYKEK